MERMKKEKKSDQNAVAELTREGLYKENKWLWEENKKLKEEIKEIEKNQEYRYHRCMVAERGGEDED